MESDSITLKKMLATLEPHPSTQVLAPIQNQLYYSMADCQLRGCPPAAPLPRTPDYEATERPAPDGNTFYAASRFWYRQPPGVDDVLKCSFNCVDECDPDQPLDAVFKCFSCVKFDPAHLGLFCATCFRKRHPAHRVPHKFCPVAELEDIGAASRGQLVRAEMDKQVAGIEQLISICQTTEKFLKSEDADDYPEEALKKAAKDTDNAGAIVERVQRVLRRDLMARKVEDRSALEKAQEEGAIAVLWRDRPHPRPAGTKRRKRRGTLESDETESTYSSDEESELTGTIDMAGSGAMVPVGGGSVESSGGSLLKITLGFEELKAALATQHGARSFLAKRRLRRRAAQLYIMVPSDDLELTPGVHVMAPYSKKKGTYAAQIVKLLPDDMFVVAFDQDQEKKHVTIDKSLLVGADKAAVIGEDVVYAGFKWTVSAINDDGTRDLDRVTGENSYARNLANVGRHELTPFYFMDTRDGSTDWNPPRILSPDGTSLYPEVKLLTPRSHKRRLERGEIGLEALSQPGKKHAYSMTEEEAAVLLQNAARRRFARDRLRQQISKLYQRILDPKSGKYYYFNLKTKAVSWTPPLKNVHALGFGTRSSAEQIIQTPRGYQLRHANKQKKQIENG